MDGLAILGQVRNEMDEAASHIKIRVTLSGDSEPPLAQKERILPVQHLQPGETFPFELPFPDVLQADHVDIDIIDFQISANNDVELEIEFSATSTTEDGKYVILGWISNNLNISVEIFNFLLLTADSEGSAYSLVMPNFHTSSLLPSEKVPFLAILDQDPSALSITPFLDAIEVQNLGAAPFSFPQKAELTQDSQGNLLLRGMIKNNDSLTRWVSCIVALRYQDRLISLTQMIPPSPLSAGENRAFGLSWFPGWKTQLSELGGEVEKIDVEVFCDSRASSEFKGQIFSLNSEITGFESTGSSLIIKGKVSNLTSHSLSYAAVQADLRSIDGFIQTSNWIILDKSIEPEGSIPFVLAVRLPEGIILSQMEIDVRAIAILEESNLPF